MSIGRLFAQQMSERLGRQIIVENIAGAGGMTGANRVANAPPDGYQVLFGGSGNLVFNQILYKKPLFNSVTDFTPVGLADRAIAGADGAQGPAGRWPAGFHAACEGEQDRELRLLRRRLLDAPRVRDAQPCDRSGRHARAVPRQRGRRCRT